MMMNMYSMRHVRLQARDSENIKCLIKACKVKKATQPGHFTQLHSSVTRLFILATKMM